MGDLRQFKTGEWCLLVFLPVCHVGYSSCSFVAVFSESDWTVPEFLSFFFPVSEEDGVLNEEVDVGPAREESIVCFISRSPFASFQWHNWLLVTKSSNGVDSVIAWPGWMVWRAISHGLA